jgi:CRISPR-associated protein Csm4
MKIVWLKPKSGYVTDLRSVTLWGTICWGIRYLFDKEEHPDKSELDEFIRRCEDAESNPDFVISSAFPFKQHGKERILYFPNPLLHTDDTVDVDNYFQNALKKHDVADKLEDIERALVIYRLQKKLKKIEFLCQSDFELMLKGELTTNHLLERLLDEYVLKLKHKKSQERERYKKDYIPHENTIRRAAPQRHDYSMTHNTIDRLRGGTLSILDDDNNPSGQLFHASDIWWSDPFDESESGEPTTGLFFLVEEIAPGSIEKYLAPVLRLLEHWGIGADRTAGKGSFEFKIEDFQLSQPSTNEANAVLNLSLLSPTPEELDSFENKGKGVFYPFTLENRECKGWTELGGFEKEPVLFFAEGSVFPRPENMTGSWLGCLRKNSENHPVAGHPVYDNGFGFMVNLKWNPA